MSEQVRVESRELRPHFRGALLGLKIRALLSAEPGLLQDNAAQPPGTQTFEDVNKHVLAALSTAKWLMGGQDDRKLEEALANHGEPVSSYSNEVAFSSVPVGLWLFDDPGRARERAREIARLTHVHPIGQDGAGVMAAAIAELALAAQQKRLDPMEFLEKTKNTPKRVDSPISSTS